jgi:hypothetical protein
MSKSDMIRGSAEKRKNNSRSNSAYDGSLAFEPTELFDGLAEVDNAKEVMAEKERLEQELDEVKQEAEEIKQEIAVIKEKALVRQDDGTMAMGRIRIDKAGLSLPPDLTLDEWKVLGEHLFSTEASLQWCIGDWIVYGEDNQFCTIQEIADALQKNPGTVYNWVWISRTFPRLPETGEKEADISYRYETLTHTHHQMIASLVKDSSQYTEWLKKAAKGTGEKAWSISELKKAIAGEKVKELPSRTATISTKTFRELMRVRRRDISTLSTDEINGYLEQVKAMRGFLSEIESKLTPQSSKAKKGKQTE